jgi:protocatechuate 3,4-dioxygenase beta subunit
MKHHDHSLAQDIEAMLNLTASRRQSLRWLFAGAAALPLAGCGAGSGVVTIPAASTVAGASSSACSLIPAETAGSNSADGANNGVNGVANALILSGIVRSDIRASFADASGVAAGVPLTIKLQLLDVASSCAPLAGAAVYLWHCDRAGLYSMYSSPIAAENYLRGVQQADANGLVTFTTIFPGCYPGRMPHVHFEIYPTLAGSMSAANRIRTSQFGFPAATLADAYGASGYAASARNLASMSYATDSVFGDGTSLQIAGITGSASLGYVATLAVGVLP